MFGLFKNDKNNAKHDYRIDDNFKNLDLQDKEKIIHKDKGSEINMDNKSEIPEELAEDIVNKTDVQEEKVILKEDVEECNKENNNHDLSCEIKEIKLLMESLQNSLDNNEIISKKITKSNDKIINEVHGIKEVIEKDKNEEILELKRIISSMKNQEKSIIKNVLHIADQFDYIFKFAEESKNIELVESMNYVMKIVKKELSEMGIEEISALGEQFSPKFHICEVAVEDESKNSNEIIDVIKKGYKRNGDVIRASKVVAVMNNKKENNEDNKII